LKGVFTLTMILLDNRISVSRLICCKRKCRSWSELSKCMPSDWRRMKVSKDNTYYWTVLYLIHKFYIHLCHATVCAGHGGLVITW